MPLFLASKSPRRRALLRELGLPFRALVPDVHENIAAPSPRRHATRVAERKVLAVTSRVKHGTIIGVDTIVVLGNRIMGKPANKADARHMLQALSGRTHRVISGVCLLRKPGNRKLLAAETTRVKFRRLSRREIEDYISTREPYDKAGAYGIQGKAGFFVERIDGDYFNVVGLPVALVLRLLKRIGDSR
jgi:septum formation protein